MTIYRVTVKPEHHEEMAAIWSGRDPENWCKVTKAESADEAIEIVYCEWFWPIGEIPRQLKPDEQITAGKNWLQAEATEDPDDATQ